MTEKTLFTCDICHTDYSTKEKAEACETEHILPKKISDYMYKAHMKNPVKIKIEFADGTSHWFEA